MSAARLAEETWLEAGVVTDPVFAAFWYFRDRRADGRSVPTEAGTLEEWLAEIAFGRGINVVPAGLADEYHRPGLAFVPVSDAPSSRLALRGGRTTHRPPRSGWRSSHAPRPGPVGELPRH